MLVMWIPCFHCVVISGLLVLDAPHLILSQKPDTYAAYFADGQNTLEAFFGLPRCEVFGGGSGEYLELYNVNASLPVEHRGSFDNGPRDSTSVQWNYTAFPMLDPSFTGLYRCRTNGITSKATYQLNVRSKMSVATSQSWDICAQCGQYINTDYSISFLMFNCIYIASKL